MPQNFAQVTAGFFGYKTIMFALFDLTRPETFYKEFQQKKEKCNMSYLMNEAQTYNKNDNLVKVLIGTNADKPHNFNDSDANHFAEQYKMTYVKISTREHSQIMEVVTDAITKVCKNIDDGTY